jgi:hypothetical protein
LSPAALVVVVGAIAVSWWLDLEERGVAVTTPATSKGACTRPCVAPTTTHSVVFDAEAVTHVDATGLTALGKRASSSRSPALRTSPESGEPRPSRRHMLTTPLNPPD